MNITVLCAGFQEGYVDVWEPGIIVENRQKQLLLHTSSASIICQTKWNIPKAYTFLENVKKITFKLNIVKNKYIFLWKLTKILSGFFVKLF